jgi:hypothetical protein
MSPRDGVHIGKKQETPQRKEKEKKKKRKEKKKEEGKDMPRNQLEVGLNRVRAGRCQGLQGIRDSTWQTTAPRQHLRLGKGQSFRRRASNTIMIHCL